MNALRLDPSERPLAQFYEPRREPVFTRKTALAVGTVLLCYAGLGVYFATMKGAPVKFDPPVEDGPIIIRPWREPAPATPVKPETPTVRAPTTTPTTPPPSALPFTASDSPAPMTMPTEFSVAEQPATAAPASPPGPAQAAAPAAPGLIRNPVWISRPTSEQVGRLYPERAAERGLSGQAILVCTIRPNGSVTACQVTSETPAGWRFGDAALAMARYFRVSPKTVDGQIVEGSKVQIPVTFSLAE